jgi:hypothetical protein
MSVRRATPAITHLLAGSLVLSPAVKMNPPSGCPSAPFGRIRVLYCGAVGTAEQHPGEQAGGQQPCVFF